MTYCLDISRNISWLVHKLWQLVGHYAPLGKAGQHAARRSALSGALSSALLLYEKHVWAQARGRTLILKIKSKGSTWQNQIRTQQNKTTKITPAFWWSPAQSLSVKIRVVHRSSSWFTSVVLEGSSNSHWFVMGCAVFKLSSFQETWEYPWSLQDSGWLSGLGKRG